MKLNGEQAAALDHLRRARADETAQTAALEVELTRLRQERLAGIKLNTDAALKRVVELNIPKARIGEALGTKDWRTIANRVAAISSELEATIPSYSSTQNEDGTFTLVLNDFDGISGTFYFLPGESLGEFLPRNPGVAMGTGGRVWSYAKAGRFGQ